MQPIQIQIYHTEYQDNDPKKPLFKVGSDGVLSDSVILTSPQDTPLKGHEMQNLRDNLSWYLEEYLQMPLGAFSEKAKDVEDTLQNWGRDCFKKLFNSGGARDWFQNARKNGLENLHLKIDSKDPAVLAWPWEALYSDDDMYISQRCSVERQLSEVNDPRSLSEDLPQDKINILYIIARPHGDRDVGFQTLARPLIDYVKENQISVNIDVLRPPTFERLLEVLHENPNFYHIVHFDGHGGYVADEHTLNDTKKGVIVFEDRNGNELFVETEKLSQLLAECRIPIMVLNACQSAMIDGSAKNPFASVAAGLLKAGIRSVAAMGYSLYVSGAKEFVPDFYKRLFKSGNVSEAMRAGRQAMYLNPKRNCISGELPLQDWIVPVLYQKLSPNEKIISPLTEGAEIEQKNFLPENVLEIGDYDFIGRDTFVQRLERAVLQQPQAGLLIHGMAGVGKTTLAKGFLNWLNDTNGLENPVIWFDFRDIQSFSYIMDGLVGEFFGTNAMALPEEEKLKELTKLLKHNRFFIVWDNFESVSGIIETEVNSQSDKTKPQKQLKQDLKNFLIKLRKGKTKIIITSRSRETWLTVQDCYPITLGGLQGEEVWEYCNAVVEDLGLKIERGNEEYAKIIEKLDGNPLAIRAILLRLQERSAVNLLAELEDEFNGAKGDDSTLRIQAAFNLFERGLDKKFAPILQLIGLHEHYVYAGFLEVILKDTEHEDSAAHIAECFTALENAGFCHHIVNNIYQMHPALRSCLAQTYPASETLQREFVDTMRSIAVELAPKQPHEQRTPLMCNEANFYRAMGMAQNLGMEKDDIALTQSLAFFMYNSRNFSQAGKLYNTLAEKSKKYGDMRCEANAYHQLGMIAGEQRDFKTAESWYLKSLEINEKQGNERGAANTYHQLGMIAEGQRDFKAAESWYKKALEIDEKQGNEHGAANTYHQLGVIAWEQRDFKTAESWYLKSLEIEEKHGNEHGAAITYHNLGKLAEEQRDFKTAESWCRKSLDIFEKQGNEHRTARTYVMLGVIAAAQDDFKTAESWCKKALDIFEKYGDEYRADKVRKNLEILYARNYK